MMDQLGSSAPGADDGHAMPQAEALLAAVNRMADALVRSDLRAESSTNKLNKTLEAMVDQLKEVACRLSNVEDHTQRRTVALSSIGTEDFNVFVTEVCGSVVNVPISVYLERWKDGPDVLRQIAEPFAQQIFAWSKHHEARYSEQFLRTFTAVVKLPPGLVIESVNGDLRLLNLAPENDPLRFKVTGTSDFGIFVQQAGTSSKPRVKFLTVLIDICKEERLATKRRATLVQAALGSEASSLPVLAIGIDKKKAVLGFIDEQKGTLVRSEGTALEGLAALQLWLNKISSVAQRVAAADGEVPADLPAVQGRTRFFSSPIGRRIAALNSPFSPSVYGRADEQTARRPAPSCTVLQTPRNPPSVSSVDAVLGSRLRALDLGESNQAEKVEPGGGEECTEDGNRNPMPVKPKRRLSFPPSARQGVVKGQDFGLLGGHGWTNGQGLGAPRDRVGVAKAEYAGERQGRSTQQPNFGVSRHRMTSQGGFGVGRRPEMLQGASAVDRQPVTSQGGNAVWRQSMTSFGGSGAVRQPVTWQGGSAAWRQSLTTQGGHHTEPPFMALQGGFDAGQQSVVSQMGYEVERQPAPSQGDPGAWRQPVPSQEVDTAERQPVTSQGGSGGWRQPVSSQGGSDGWRQPVTSQEVDTAERQPVTSQGGYNVGRQEGGLQGGSARVRQQWPWQGESTVQQRSKEQEDKRRNGRRSCRPNGKPNKLDPPKDPDEKRGPRTRSVGLGPGVNLNSGVQVTTTRQTGATGKSSGRQHSVPEQDAALIAAKAKSFYRSLQMEDGVPPDTENDKAFNHEVARMKRLPQVSWLQLMGKENRF